MQPRSWVRIPQQTVVVARAAFPNGGVAMSVRDRLGVVFNDEQFTAAFGVCGDPAESPGALQGPGKVVTVSDLRGLE